ncbi:glycoside hydrolase family 2 TIM barrel-domain containing protein [Halarchaeum sp. P4]|uniref:glycoside hydrolase family 2 TIM barrel-domain containing protein n=1 Tax=Halarchaeum sp. P4 TaxID=3421639 RepID=UPI003EBD3BCB
MSKHEHDETTDESTTGRLSTSRRRFLQATGLTALAGGTAVDSVAAASTSESLTPGGPGAIDNLSAYIEDPTMYEQHREPTHVTAAMPYESVAAARNADERFAPLEERYGKSSYVELLNGEWDFAFYKRPADVPDSLSGMSWDSIAVPSVWQTEGYDQYIYTNNDITWDQYEPALDGSLQPSEGIDVPDTNPVGVYRRSMQVPADWGDREVFLHFGGVKQAYFVWVDGEYVGFQQGSMTPGEFDVTDHVTPGEEHDVVVQVYRFSDGEALETIDMFRYSGIYRSVYLYSTPKVHLRDFYVQSSLDDDYADGELRIDAEVTNYTDTKQGRYGVRAHLYDPDGSRVTTLSEGVTVDADGGTVTLETTVSDPEKWSAEHPNLYEVGLELVSKGSTVEAVYDKIGFRTYETTRGERGAHVLVNGEPVNVRGTNRHETDPDTGRTLPVETMRADLERMKQFNVDAVRTSHYPNDPTFLRLADEYGVYVQDEVNVETHWWQGLLANTDVYHDQAVARFQRMVLRDRNHASVFSWSTGNEAGTGAEHLDMASFAMASDEHLPADTSGVTGVSTVESFDGDAQGMAPDRIMYHQPNGGGWDVAYSDMLGPRYAGVDTLLSVGDGSSIGEGKRPVVMGEYNHAMGNSLGLVHAMWDDHIQPPVRRARNTAGESGDGVLVGDPTVDTGRTAGAVTLDSDDHIEVTSPSSVDFTSPGFSLAVAFKGLTPNTEVDFVAKGEQYALTAREGMHFEFAVGDAMASGKVRGNLATDEWHTLVGVCSGDRLTLYLDGSKVGESTHSLSSVPSSDDVVRVGYNGQNGADGDMAIDAVHAFDRALSSSEAGSPADADGAVLAYDFSGVLRDQSLNGGFIWDWVNQDVTVTRDGTTYQFYDDDPFCLNGLVWSDRTAQPELWQLKHSHQPVKVAARDLTAGEVYVTNHFGFTDLREFDVSWQLSANDEVVQSGSLDLELAPGETRPVSVPLDAPSDPAPGTEYWLEVSVTRPEATAYADAGHEVAFDQFEVPFDVPEPSVADPAALPSGATTESDSAVTVSGDGFAYTLDKKTGTFSSLTYEGTELVEDGPRLNAWRAPIMNEVQAWGSEQASSWYEAGLNDLTQTVKSVQAEQSDGVANITVEAFLEGASAGNLLRTPDESSTDSDGTVHGDPDIVAGRSGQAIAFDGSDDYVNAGAASSVNFTSPGFTVEATFRGLDVGGHKPLVTKGDSQYALKANDGEFSFFIYDPSADDSPWKAVSAPIPDGFDGSAWHTLVGVCTEGELVLYLDGEVLATESHSVTDINDSGYPIHVAHNAEKADRYTPVTVDSARVYDTPLTQSEVQSGFDSVPDSAVLWYDFDTFTEVTSIRVTPDATDNGNRGVLQNSPSVVSGVSGTALDLSGQSYVSLDRSDTLDITEGGVTVECWVKPGEPQDGGSAQPYVTKGRQYLVKRREAGRGGALEFAFNADGWESITAPVPDDWTGNWHHLAGVWDADAGELRFYVDGERKSTQAYDGTLQHWDAGVTVGSDGSTYVADGTVVDNARIYDRGLSDDEVGQPDTKPLDGAVAWLNFDSFDTVKRNGPGFATTYRYRVFGSGDVTLDVHAEPNDRLLETVTDYLPKVGVRVELPESFDEFEWYGRGPEETYPDRKWGVRVGRYAGSVEDQYVPYLPPTDNGNKADTRWAALTNGDGTGLLGVARDDSMNVNLQQWSNLAEAGHQHELEARGSVGFDLDHAVSGVGGTPTEPLDKHLVRPRPMSFGFVLRPFTADDDPMALAKAQFPTEN